MRQGATSVVRPIIADLIGMPLAEDQGTAIVSELFNISLIFVIILGIYEHFFAISRSDLHKSPAYSAY